MKILRDNYSVFEYALETATAEAEAKGMEKGRGEGRFSERYETIKKLESKGKTLDKIADLLDFSIEEVLEILAMFRDNLSMINKKARILAKKNRKFIKTSCLD